MFKTIFALILFSMAFCAYAEDVVVDGPWVREAPPNAKALAGYLIVQNNGKNVQELTGIASPMFEKVEFHVTTFEGGMMRMKQLPSLVLKPGEVAEFEPGGKHLMLINPSKRLKAGDVVPMSIDLKGGKKLSFDMEVRR